MGASDPFPAGRVVSFGSLEFRATGNGYLMQLLSSERDLIAPTPPARRNGRSGQRSRQARAERRRAARRNSPHVGRGWHVATQHHGQRGHRFVVTYLDVLYAGIVTCCGTSASQGGFDFGVALPLRDAQRCRPRLVNRR